MRTFLVDTLATIVFFTTVAAFSELVVAGMEPRQVLIARAIMVPVMVATGRPYGLWRDWLFARLRPRSRLAALATDTAAFLGFQVPVYAATLAAAGADGAEIARAVGAAIVFMIAVGRPFGVFLEAVRRATGTAAGRPTPPA